MKTFAHSVAVSAITNIDQRRAELIGVAGPGLHAVARADREELGSQRVALHPVAQLAAAIVVLLPLVIHTVWGIGRLLTARPNNVRYPLYGNLKYALQRLSAIGVLFFLGAHIWLAMLHPRIQEGHPETFADIAHEMHFHRPTLIVYMLGTPGVVSHPANGAQSFCLARGVVRSQGVLNRLEWTPLLSFLVLCSMSRSLLSAL